MSHPPRLFDWLLLLFPPAFRERFGEDMRATFATVHGARRGRPLAIFVLWVKTIGQALVVAALEWRDGLGARRPIRRAPSASARRPREVALTIWMDLRTAWRTLMRSRGVAATAVLTAALGIGANTAVFSVTDRVLWRPLDYADPARLVAIWPGRAMSLREVAVLRERTRTLSSIATVAGWNVALTGVPDPTQLSAARVSANLFELLGTPPLAGRGFVPQDSHPGAPAVVVLSYRLWQTRFAGDPAVIGRSLSIDGEPHRVVGIMPRGFEFLDPERQLWIVLREDPAHWTYSANISAAIARLAPGATVAGAQADLEDRLKAVRAAFGYAHDYGRDATVVGLRESLVGDYHPAFRLLVGAVVLILLVAVSNLANLLLVRAEARRGELAVRAALGATRARLVCLAVADAVVLAAAGGAAGLGVAYTGLALASRVIPPETPRLNGLALDGSVLVASIGFTALTALLIALAPSLAVRRLELESRVVSVRPAAGASAGHAARQTWIALQVAMAVVLVVAAGLMIRTLDNLLDAETGFTRTNVLTLRLYPTGPAYDTPAEYRQYYDEALARVGVLPGVRDVAAIQHLPFSGISWGLPFEPVDGPVPPGEAKPVAGWHIIAGRYFKTMGIRLLQGRGFEPRDNERAPAVAIVSAALARRYWPDGSAVGRRLRLGRTGDSEATIVGVAADVRYASVQRAPDADIYRPLSQSTMPALMLAVRTVGEPNGAAAAVQAALKNLDPDVPVSHVMTLDALVSGTFGRPRLLVTLLSAFAAIALALGAVGINGVTSFVVGRRTGEIGVRMALGASAARIRAEVLRQSLTGALAGTLVGLLVAVIAGRFLAELVYGVSPRDPAILAAVAVSMLLVALVASDMPARRATRVEPAKALRDV